MTTETLSADELAEVTWLLNRIERVTPANTMHERYYDGTFVARLLNISTPEHVSRILKTVSGWAATTVDVIEERLDLLGFADDDLTEVFDANALDEEASQIHLDSMVYGIGFVSVTSPDTADSDALIRGHDAKNTTARINARTRSLDSALTREVVEGEVRGIELWTAEQIITATRAGGHAPWTVVDRQFHNLGAVPMVPFINRPRTGNRAGKSEITAPIRSYTDAAVRTLISMDVNREFFSAPQRYAIGLTQDDFIGPDGRPLSPWQIITGKIWMAPDSGPDRQPPSLGEFKPQPAGPFLEQLEGLAQLAAAEAGLPGHYFGLRGDQATSADAIRAMEARLVKRAERRQTSFGRSWSQVARLVRAGRDGVSVADAEASRARWGNPATPTVGATADAMVKLVQAGVLPGNSRVVWDRVGVTPEEQRVLSQEVAAQRAAQRLSDISHGDAESGAPAAVTGGGQADTFLVPGQ